MAILYNNMSTVTFFFSLATTNDPAIKMKFLNAVSSIFNQDFEVKDELFLRRSYAFLGEVKEFIAC